MAKKKKLQAAQAPQYTPYDVSGKIGGDAFEVIGSDASSMEAIARPSISFMKDAWNRIKKSRVAVVCMVILALIILGAIFLPMICPFGYEQQNVAFQNKPIMSPDSVTGQMHIFGTDALGRDVFARVWYGARISLTVAVAVALIDCFVGVIYGGVSGYFGGAVDTVMMRIVDIISTIPLTLYVILIMQVMGDGIQSIIVALGSVYWVDMARVVRGQVLSLKQQEFVLAAKTIGSSPKTILLQHLIPNAMGSILVTLTMLIPSAIFMEAFLGYLGIGLQPPLASLGTMCNDASANLRTSPHELFIPALMICAIMFAFNFVGDGLRDALDPKLKK